MAIVNTWKFHSPHTKVYTHICRRTHNCVHSSDAVGVCICQHKAISKAFQQQYKHNCWESCLFVRRWRWHICQQENTETIRRPSINSNNRTADDSHDLNLILIDLQVAGNGDGEEGLTFDLCADKLSLRCKSSMSLLSDHFCLKGKQESCRTVWQVLQSQRGHTN